MFEADIVGEALRYYTIADQWVASEWVAWRSASGALPSGQVLGGLLHRAGRLFQTSDSFSLPTARNNESLRLLRQVLDDARHFDPPLFVKYMRHAGRAGGALACGRRERGGGKAVQRQAKPVRFKEPLRYRLRAGCPAFET